MLCVGLSSNQHDSSTTAPSSTLTESSLTTLVGDNIEGDEQWSAFVDGGDGFVYGIPSNARRVVKFNPLDKSLTEIGPDLGEGYDKWRCGVRANNGRIYCAPYAADHILKIDPIQGTVETLENVRGSGLWASGALAPDNFIYYMPADALWIMRLNPDNDTLSRVGDYLGGGGGGGRGYIGTVVGNYDCVYGIPYYNETPIVQFDPANPDTTFFVGEAADEWFYCGNGLLGGDGDVYAANDSGQVLKVGTTSNKYTWIGDRIYSRGRGWGDPIVGADKCIYWPPYNANRVLKFDPETQQLPSLVGDDLGEGEWWNGALATDGVIYCIPSSATTQILAIDPFKELSMTMQNNIIKYPQELGWLFAKKDDGCNETFYGSAVRKFGIEKVFKFVVEECLPSDKEWVDTHRGNLPLFMVAASCESCTVSIMYHLLRRNVHDVIIYIF